MERESQWGSWLEIHVEIHVEIHNPENDLNGSFKYGAESGKIVADKKLSNERKA